MNEYRTHTCGELNLTHLEANVRLSGWVHRIRNHGGMAFIDIRDNYGITQLVVDSQSTEFATLETLRVESVIRVDGTVRARPQGTQNLKMTTGMVELKVTQLEILNAADELPMPVAGEADYPEDIRLKYRFLDLRRETLHRNILKRTQIIASMRRIMTNKNFVEFATPILTASSPEGARDYLVPSRVHQGKFFALPQAPQQYKQLLMVSGFDKYFQIASCFRDEDPRTDRLPGEFYQLDMEMSFVNQEDLLQTMEPVLRDIFIMYGENKPVTQTFPRIPYAEAIRKYGSDKPDLRNPLVIHDVTEHFSGSQFKLFADAIENQAEVWAVPAPKGGTRSFTKKVSTWAQQQGFMVGEIIFDNGEAKSGPISNHLGRNRCLGIRHQLDLDDGDAAFVILGKPMDIYKYAGALRTHLGTELNLINTERFEFCWIVDFPFYELNDEGQLEFAHNPFSMPQDPLDGDPLGIRAYQFDAVCNGFELASGSIRNHNTQTMLEAFAKVGMDRQAVETNFGALFDAFRFGAPPHGGMAAGVDRIVMLLCGAKNLREVSLFPMNQQAQDLLMNAPSEPTTKQRKELGLK